MLENGTPLVVLTGAGVEVVRLFAVFHDSRRVNEGWDQGHGLHGADFAAKLRGELFELAGDRFDLLYTARALQTDGLTDGDVTIQTCWDADQLDLGRVGMRPEPVISALPPPGPKR